MSAVRRQREASDRRVQQAAEYAAGWQKALEAKRQVQAANTAKNYAKPQQEWAVSTPPSPARAVWACQLTSLPLLSGLVQEQGLP